MIVLFGLFMAMPFLEGRSDKPASVLISILIGGGFILFFLYALLSIFKGRIEIYSDRIRDVCLFQSRELLISNISGFKILPTQYTSTLLLLPKNSKDKKIKTNLVFEHKEELLDWLDRNLTNLDDGEFQEEMDLILHDSELGLSEEQRLRRLDKARRWARILNGAALILILWASFKPQPYTYVIWTSVFFPLIALYSLKHFEGALKFDSKTNSAYPNIAPVFLMPCLGLALRALLDFNILNWGHFWRPFSIFSLSIFILVMLIARDIRHKVGQLVILVIFCIIYGYSTVVTLNGILDNSPPSLYKAGVIEKRISSGKHTSYYLKLSPWGPRKEEEEVDVGRTVYSRYNAGDDVNVILKQGKFKIPWFYVR